MDVLIISGRRTRRVREGGRGREDEEIGGRSAELEEGAVVRSKKKLALATHLPDARNNTINLPNSKEDAPENPLANLILDVVEGKLIRSGRTDIIAVSRTFVWMLRPLEAQLVDKTERLGHVQTEDVHLESIRGGQREEVAGSRVIESLWLLRRPLDATGLEGDVTALVNHDGGTREDMHTLLVLEMRAGGSREGCDEGANHARKKRQELGISPIISIDEGSLERRLMGEGAKRMNVCEKVVDKGFQDGPGRNGLAIEVNTSFVNSCN